MAYYLLQVASAPAAALLKNPEERLDALRPAARTLGGTLQEGWLAFGEYDLVLLVQMPDNVRAAAFSTAISEGGTAQAVKITPLMTIQEGMEAAQGASVAAIPERMPLPEGVDESEMTPQQIQELLAPNLEYAAACAESAHHVIRELGIQDTLPTVDTAVAHGLHFLQLAQHYLEELQHRMRQSPTDSRKGDAEG